jgi:superfamily II DNA or RNA helicase
MLDEGENKGYLELLERFQYLLQQKSLLEFQKKSTYHINKKLEFLVFERKHFLNNLKSSELICKRLMKDIYQQNKECKILVFCELNKQADAVCKYTYHSDTEEADNLKRFCNDEIQALAVCGKINRGVNISGVNNIIFESCNQSNTQLTQRLGRGKRLQVDQFLNAYFLVPYFMTKNNKLRPTKVHDWIYAAAKGLDLGKSVVYKFKN